MIIKIAVTVFGLILILFINLYFLGPRKKPESSGQADAPQDNKESTGQKN
jgi:plastocyanin domain-containing protein